MIKLLNYLPLSYEEDEVELLCQTILYEVCQAMDESRKWDELCKKYNWNGKEIEQIAVENKKMSEKW